MVVGDDLAVGGEHHAGAGGLGAGVLHRRDDAHQAGQLLRRRLGGRVGRAVRAFPCPGCDPNGLLGSWLSPLPPVDQRHPGLPGICSVPEPSLRVLCWLVAPDVLLADPVGRPCPPTYPAPSPAAPATTAVAATPRSCDADPPDAAAAPRPAGWRCGVCSLSMAQENRPIRRVPCEDAGATAMCSPKKSLRSSVRQPGTDPSGRTWRCDKVIAPVSPLAGSAGIGLWRSLVAHLTGGQGVAGSNPVSPTKSGRTSSQGRAVTG